MEFEQYLKSALEKPVHESYNPDGNSARAIVVRGFWREVLWQYKAFPRRVKYAIGDFEGLDTPVGWFLQVPFMIALSPVLPVTAAIYWHKKSVAEYRRAYETWKSEH